MKTTSSRQHDEAVRTCETCGHCGAEITYRVPFDRDDEDDEEPTPPATPTECMQVLDRYMKAPWEVPMGSLRQALDVLRELAAGVDMKEVDAETVCKMARFASNEY